MTKHLILSAYGILGCLLACTAHGATQPKAKVEMNTQNPNFTNDDTIIVDDGYGVWANGITGFNGKFINNGNILVTGADGWGFYETPYHTRTVRFNIKNTGTIQRMNMEQVDNDAQNFLKFASVEWKDIRPGLSGSVAFDSSRPHISNDSGLLKGWGNSFLIENEGTIEGAALFGVNTTIKNTGTFRNFDLDNSLLEKGNLVSMAFNGLFLNGIDWDLWYENGIPVKLVGVAWTKEAELTTDKVQFAEQGMFINGARVDNKSFSFGDYGYLYNVGTPHDYTGEVGGEASYIPSIKTGTLTMGDNSLIYNEMGTDLTVDNLKTGNNTDIVVGGNYSLVVEEEAIIRYKDSDGNDVEEEVVLPDIPHAAHMQATKAVLGNNSSLRVLNNGFYTGETLTMGKENNLVLSGGTIDITTPEGNGLLSVGDSSIIQVEGAIQAEVAVPSGEKTTDETTGAEEEIFEIIEKKPIDGLLTADTLQAGDRVTMSITAVDDGEEIGADATVRTNKSIFGDYADISVINSEKGLGFAHWLAKDYISLKDYAHVTDGDLTHGATINTPLFQFGDNGVFDHYGELTYNPYDFNLPNTGQVGKLIMGKKSLINNYGAINLATTLGSDSQAYLLRGSPADFKYEFDTRLPRFTQGVKSADGATNVTIINRTGVDQDYGRVAGYLTGGIDVDNIIVDTGELQMSGDVKGFISINTDAQLRLVDDYIYIHDPITKIQDATNTKLIIDLKDDTFYKTSNTINVDHIFLAAGGIEIDNATRAQDIIFSSNTTVRLNDNHFVGDMVEVNEDSANTTLAINAKQGKTIYSTGTTKLDRVVVESGTFNINHTLEATYKSSSSVMPSTNESGLELNTDTTVNVNTENVLVNRIVRGQLAQDLGEKVTNTSVNVNSGKLLVERNVDVDQLSINGGWFEFQNKDTDNVVNIGNNLTINHGGTLAGAGVMNLRNGSLDVNKGGRFSVSSELLEDKPVSKMEIIQSEKIYSDADDITDKGYATVNFQDESILDLRADGQDNDKVIVSGEVNIESGTRVILRGIEANTEYDLIKATKLNGDLDSIRTSFLWTGTTFRNRNNTLTLSITGVQTLAQGIASTRHSANVDSIAEALNEINNRAAANTIDPFIDNVFYAQTAEEAVGVLTDYSPEGYLNLPHAGLRMSHIFRQSAQTELDDMRTYRDMETAHFNQPVTGYYASNPNYFGRPGYEAYYSSWSNTRGRSKGQRYSRTDKGGLWARPFTTTASQDNAKYISGFDFSSSGLTAGVDKRFGALSLGVMGLYADGSLKQNNHQIKSDIKTYGAGIYGYLRPYKSRSFVNMYALWTESSNKAKHRVNSLVESAKADFNMNTYTFGADWGIDIPVNRNTIITPRMGVDYTKVATDKFEEKGLGKAKVQVMPDNYTSIQTPVEIRAAFNYGNEFFRLKPEAHARWTHEFGDVKATGKGKFVNYDQVFGFEGVSVARDTYTLGGSLLWLYSVSELEFKYDYDFSSSSSGHTLNASYKYMF